MLASLDTPTSERRDMHDYHKTVKSLDWVGRQDDWYNNPEVALHWEEIGMVTSLTIIVTCTGVITYMYY